MANIREIQSRINSVKDTMKITNAMYMISSSKMTQARKKLADTEPYFYGLQGEISRILRHVPEIRHSYFDARQDIPAEQKRIGSIVITADKGLAGAYNHNIIKLEEEILAQPGIHKLSAASFVKNPVTCDDFQTKCIHMPRSYSAASAFAFAMTSSIVPTLKNADSGYASISPSMIILNPRIVSFNGTYFPGIPVNVSATKNG